GSYRFHVRAVGVVRVGPRGGGHLFGGVRRAWPASDYGELRQASGRQQDLRRAIVPPAVEGEYGRRDPADLRLLDHSVARNRDELVFSQPQYALAERSVCCACAAPAALCHVVFGADHFLLLFLYGSRIQQPRDRRQSEEKWCLRSGNPSW